MQLYLKIYLVILDNKLSLLKIAFCMQYDLLLNSNFSKVKE